MKAGLRYFSIRLLVAVLVFTALAFYIKEPQFAAQRIVPQQHAQLQKASQNIQSAQKIITAEPAPAATPLQDPSQARRFANSLAETANSYQPVQLSFPKPGALSYGWWPAGSVVRQTRQRVYDATLSNRYKQTSQTLAAAKTLLTYHGAVYRALHTLLGYNPTADFTNYSKTSEDSGNRIVAARNGLTQLDQQLATLTGHYPDEGLGEIRAAVASLQSDLNSFQLRGDSGQWTKQVAVAQQTIITNRQQFWKAASTDMLQQLEAAQRNTDGLERQWNY